MSPAEIQNVNASCRPLDQVRKSQRLWSEKNELGEMECKGPDGILRVQFTKYGGAPKSYSIIYYFISALDPSDVRSSIETQYGLANPKPPSASSVTVYSWQIIDRGPARGVDLFLAMLHLLSRSETMSCD